MTDTKLILPSGRGWTRRSLGLFCSILQDACEKESHTHLRAVSQGAPHPSPCLLPQPYPCPFHSSSRLNSLCLTSAWLHSFKPILSIRCFLLPVQTLSLGHCVSPAAQMWAGQKSLQKELRRNPAAKFLLSFYGVYVNPAHRPVQLGRGNFPEEAKRHILDKTLYSPPFPSQIYLAAAITGNFSNKRLRNVLT